MQVVAASNQTILRGKLLPWAIAAAVAITGGVLIALLGGFGVLERQATSSGVLFFSIITGGVMPRAIPTLVEIRVDALGFTVRDLFLSSRINWNEVMGPFTVGRTALGEGICFTRRNGLGGQRLFYRSTLNNVYGLPSQTLADILNQRRDQFLQPIDSDRRG